MSGFFRRKRTVVMSVILILTVFAVNLTALRSLRQTMASLRQVPILNVQTDRKAVALTFNLTESDNADLILEKLGSRRATFFISRGFLMQYPEKVSKIMHSGQGIGLLEGQMKKIERTVIFDSLAERIEETAAVTGVNCDLVRIENNKYDGNAVNAIYGLGLYPVQWSADSSAENFRQGDIILVTPDCDYEKLFENIEKSGCITTTADDLLIKGSFSVDINGTMLPY